MPVSNLTIAEYEALRNKAILKYSQLSYKTVQEHIFKLKLNIMQSRVDLVWACLYVINLYDPAADENYITEKQLLNIGDLLQRA